MAVPAGVDGGGSGRPATAATGTSSLDHDADYFQVPRDRGDLADILYTSGTTGHPKAVAVRHDNSSLVPFRTPQWSGGGWIHASPPYTFAGLAFVYTPMKLGLRGIYLPRFDAGTWLDTVESERPGFVFLVPAMATLLLDHPRFDSADLGSVVQCTVGSAPLAPRVLERLQEKMPDALVSNNYGMTEAGSVYCLMPPGEAVKRPGLGGQAAAPGRDRLRRRRRCARRRPARSARSACGSRAGPASTTATPRPRPGPGSTAGWSPATSAGSTPTATSTSSGRSKDVIIRGGNNIHPTDVEHAIASHPAVHEVAVLGVPHPVLGEDVVAFVALRPGCDDRRRRLRDHTLGHLARYKVPRQWYFVDALPRNATGKVVKDRLRASSSRRTADAGVGTPLTAAAASRPTPWDDRR